MTPAARLQASIDILGAWQAGTPIERALTAWARKSRFAGSKDRRAIRDTVYDVLRQKGVCAALGGGQTPRALLLGLARAQGLPIADLFSGQGYGPSALSAAEAGLIDQPVEIAHALNTPDWLREKLAQHYADWAEIEEHLANRAPLFLRVNPNRASMDDARARLAQDGIETVCANAPYALEVTDGAPRVAQSQAYASGMVEPQDLSVQMACARIDWPAQRVLDYCAGGGGKALAIVAQTGGAVDAHDIEPKRMSDIPDRARRGGAQLRTVADPLPGYDLVLTDVPCSGSGTWRRDPEAKWRLTPDRLSELCTIQAEILDRAAQLAPRIVYMTCSFLPEENGQQIDQFLAARPDWVRVSQHMFTPIDASDGFFVAELSRIGGNPP